MFAWVMWFLAIVPDVIDSLKENIWLTNVTDTQMGYSFYFCLVGATASMILAAVLFVLANNMPTPSYEALHAHAVPTSVSVTDASSALGVKQPSTPQDQLVKPAVLQYQPNNSNVRSSHFSQSGFAPSNLKPIATPHQLAPLGLILLPPSYEELEKEKEIIIKR